MVPWHFFRARQGDLGLVLVSHGIVMGEHAQATGRLVQSSKFLIYPLVNVQKILWNITIFNG